jgi:site-specific recombinase XerD
MMKLDIEAFLKYLTKDKGYSQNTVAAYRNDLTQMAAFITVEQAKHQPNHSSNLWLIRGG